MVRNIYNHLKEKGLNPYLIGQHKGVCEEPFVIIREGTQMPSFRSRRVGQKVIDIILFGPINSYVVLIPYRENIIEALKELKCLRKTGTETQTIVDDDKKAYTTSIEYILIKKLEG